VVVAVGVAAGIGVLLWLVLDRSSSSAPVSSAAATTTAEAVRRDLVETETFDGTLEHGDARTVKSGLAGTITALAREGSTIKRGGVLYRVDATKVVLLYGRTPAWRRLREGDEGIDVRQLEGNLVALGFDPDRDVTIDGDFTSATAAAVERWQESLGVTEDGVVELGEVAFLPGARRIGAHAVSLGDAVQPSAPVFETSATTQVVTLQLEASAQDLVARGDDVGVVLPDGRRLAGVVDSIGEVATAPTQDQTGGTTTASTIEVTIALRGAAAPRLDEAPVDVELITDSRANVLAVPVTALVALLGGGYAVEVGEPGASHLVRVEPGVYADGYVEVTGGDLRAGDRVVVPR
jgi:peptidoglycan hydrolase-like protein with peptidoglycan-binding domain